MNRRLTAPGEFAFDPTTHGGARQQRLVRTLVALRAWPELSDEDDRPIWQTAVVAGAQYVVSQNVRHFPPLAQGHHIHGGVEYVTAIELIEDVLGESAAAAYDRPLPVQSALRSGRAR